MQISLERTVVRGEEAEGLLMAIPLKYYQRAARTTEQEGLAEGPENRARLLKEYACVEGCSTYEALRRLSVRSAVTGFGRYVTLSGSESEPLWFLRVGEIKSSRRRLYPNPERVEVREAHSTLWCEKLRQTHHAEVEFYGLHLKRLLVGQTREDLPFRPSSTISVDIGGPYNWGESQRVTVTLTVTATEMANGHTGSEPAENALQVKWRLVGKDLLPVCPKGAGVFLLSVGRHISGEIGREEFSRYYLEWGSRAPALCLEYPAGSEDVYTPRFLTDLKECVKGGRPLENSWREFIEDYVDPHIDVE